MKARIATLAGALVLAATALSAQTAATFNLEGGAVFADPTGTPQPTVSFGGSNYYSSPYSGQFETSPGVYSVPFLAWCVDYNHESVYGTSWDVEVSQLDGSLVDTRHPSEADEYGWAAEFASDMLHPPTTGALDWNDPTNGTTYQAEDVALQEAMWYAISDGAYTSSTLGASLTDVLGAGYDPLFYENSSGFDVKGWFLITGTGDGATDQEFLAYNPPGFKENITPEPASLSLMGMGLAGVFGMGFRRRKRNS